MKFLKYHGTGNDFIMIDDREELFPSTNHDLIKHLCDRHFGIGADGLILLQLKNGKPQMVYFNSDGNQSTMCGNGGRCFTSFCDLQNLVDGEFIFDAIDGEHHSMILSDGTVSLGMSDVDEVLEKNDGLIFIDTGSPHILKYRSDVRSMDVPAEGASIRYSSEFKEEGVNVNFVEEIGPNQILVRTYERGVEDETLSCGTGVTAAALSYMKMKELTGEETIQVETPGGQLKVSAKSSGSAFRNIKLIGPTAQVFTGEISI